MNLVAFGCSYTYGQGLEDCHIDSSPFHLPGPRPSSYSWPYLLANLLELDCINLSQSGFSNGAILDQILQHKFNSNDIVCVMWTFKNRDVQFQLNKEYLKFGRWDTKWYKKQNVFDLCYKNALYIHHAMLYLKSKNINHYFMDIDFLHDYKLPLSILKDIEFVDIDFKKLYNSTPLALDNLHPGKLFHSSVALALKSYMER